MKSRWVPSVTLAFALAITGCQAGVAPLSQEDADAIWAVGSAIDEAVLAGDWDAVGAMFSVDALIMSPNMPSMQGRAALLEFVESVGFAMTRHRIEFPDIGGYGDIAYARGTYDEAFTMGGAEELMEDEGKILAILRKQPDDSWLITHWITNSDLPLPPAEGEHSEEGEHG
jgi:ketosteroid isomerase-like protein